jgi:hypothetical protein
MVRGFALVLGLALPLPVFAGTAGDLARAIRESSFDRDECYRVRDLTIVKDDIRIYLTDGHLIFSKPVAGRRIAAVFVADVEGGDGEVLLRPPDVAERRSLAGYIDSPTLDEHFETALFLFTGNDYDELKGQFPRSAANRKSPEAAPLMDDEWTSVLRNLGESYQTRLTLDLLDGPGHPPGIFAGLFNGRKLGAFDVIFDPASPEQIAAGRVVTRNDQRYFDTWTSFRARATRQDPAPPRQELFTGNYRIEATVNPDLSLSAVTRVTVKSPTDGLRATVFEITPLMAITEVTVDGKPAEFLQRDSLRVNLSLGGNGLFVVVPPEPLRAGREYEFAFHHNGKVILDAGDRVFYVTARGNWYPIQRGQFSTYDMRFKYPQDLDLVTAGDVVEDRTEGEWRITRRKTAAPIRLAGFNLGNYLHARVERGGYTVDVCANRALERDLKPKADLPPLVVGPPSFRKKLPDPMTTASPPPPPSPAERLKQLADGVAAALEFMTSKFGPPALPHLTVSPIPGAFGQGFPGLIYLSTLSYLKALPRSQMPVQESQALFFLELLQAHETAHQWWGNRVAAGSYRDNWLMEGLANFSALLYLEKTRGPHVTGVFLDSYRNGLLEKNPAGQTVDSSGPIVLGGRLENSQQPTAWRTITYGKGTWIMQMLRRRMGDERFLAMLKQTLKRYDQAEVTTEEFRQLAAEFLPPNLPDPKLELFFDQWVYGTGIPNLKLSYTLKGTAPALKLSGTLTQSEVDAAFSTLVPVEIRVAPGRTITQWIRSASDPVTFTVALKQAPLKVTLDPNHAVLRR